VKALFNGVLTDFTDVFKKDSVGSTWVQPRRLG